MEFKPYKDNKYLETSYYRIPQELFVSSLYKDKLNSDSKILYAFLLDRLSLSQKNHWIDEEKNIYLIFTREEVQEKLNLSDKTATKAFKMTTGKTIALTRRTFVGKVISLLLNMLSRLVITFLSQEIKAIIFSN